MNKILFFLFPLSVSSGFCQDTAYKSSIDAWHTQRVEKLKGENGWLNVVGLFWLKEGENSFGTEKGNTILLPKGKAEARMGTFVLKDGKVTLEPAHGIELRSGEKKFSGGLIFDGKDENTLTLSYKSLKWFIIKRGEKYAIRLRDLQSDALLGFTHIKRFPVDEKWKISATYIPPEKEKTIPVMNVLGMVTETPFGGTLKFEIEGKQYQLDATLEGKELFIVFADATSGAQTYGGGRFLYAAIPEDGNTVILDFNKAYNPPCAFTEFATCPLPPDQNKLSLLITAGEKTYVEH